MVSISEERAVVTERRLRAVLRKTRVRHLPELWSFIRYEGSVPDDAIALVRDEDGWCALVPIEGRENFCLTSMVFPEGLDNSGFVGWMASTIKRELGSGVFVICGDNPQRGGIFDYCGYPAEVAERVRSLIGDLRGIEVDSSPLDLRLFRVTGCSPASAISSETIFEVRERDGLIEAQ